MTTVITPSSGQGVLYTQQGAGTSPGYSALDDRRLASGALQEGVYGTSRTVTAGGVANVAAADFMVTQRAAGANLSVDVNMPSGGFAWVQGDTIDGQGLYGVPVHSANINEAIAAADPSNPRIDQVILEVQDNVLDASGGNLARTRVLTGTPTAGATLTNRSGAASLPGSALLLADVLVGAGVSTLGNAVIRDRRKWARGVFVRQTLTSGGNPTTNSASLGTISALLQGRVECSGVPLRITLLATAGNTTAGDGVLTGCFVDGAAIDGLSDLGFFVSSAANVSGSVGFVYTSVPSAGSHYIAPTFAVVNGGTASMQATTSNPIEMIIEEIVRANVYNNAVTSG